MTQQSRRQQGNKGLQLKNVSPKTDDDNSQGHGNSFYLTKLDLIIALCPLVN